MRVIFLPLKKMCTPLLKVLQCQVDKQNGWSKLLFHLPAPKIHLIYFTLMEDIIASKLIRTDAIFDLIQDMQHIRHRNLVENIGKMLPIL